MRSVTNWSHQISLKHGSSTGAYHWVRHWEPGTTPLVGDLATRPPDKTWQSLESSWQLHPKSPSCKATLDIKLFNHHSHIWGVLKNGGSPSHHGCLKWPNDLHDVPCCWRIDCISQSRNSRSPQSKKALLQRSGSKVNWGILGRQSKPVSPKWTTTDQHWPKSRDSYAQGLTYFHLEPTQILEKSGAVATQINHWTGQWLHGVHRGWSSQVRK